jgi:branched-chain amino acid transport system ATP-binding protein
MSTGENGSRLVLEGFTVARGDRDVVRDVNLEIPQGEVTALLGPNGAGKSSLVLGVAGVLRPSSGSSIKLDGNELAGKRPERIRRSGVAVVPEGRRLLSELTVEENIEVACYALSREDGVQGRQWALELFPELEQRFDTAASSLSGGEQQMLVLAQALVSKPKFILIDELSLGLAPVVLKRLIPTIRTVAESGVGVLLIEQFATVALDLAQQVHVMDRGRIESSGSAAQFKENPELLQSSYLLRGSLEAAG